MEIKNINLGIFGHIDHGKTSLAKVLTEIPSTSSLDKLPESKKRGITIDIGFSSFNLKNYMITLVDAPGHADLIRAVVSAADIIDLALLVVDAKEGPKTQTGEHLLILDYFKIPTIVLITKIDNATKEEIERTENFIKVILKSTENLKDSPILKISAKENIGIDTLKEEIIKKLDSLNIIRDTESYLKMPIDHAFPIKGIGTVLTGTVLKGKLKVGDELLLLPQNMDNIKVKSIQRFKKSVDEAYAGDRIGISVQNVDYKQIFRGCVLTNKDTNLKVVKDIVAKIKISNIFKYTLKPKMKVHLNVGMLIVPAEMVPFRRINYDGGEENIIVKEIGRGDEVYCYFKLEEEVIGEVGENILITRLDLPPTTLRICGKGEILSFDNFKDLNIKREVVKTGQIKIDKNRTVVVGLSTSKEGGKKLIGKRIYVPERNIYGKIIDTFGTKGNLICEFEGPVSNKDIVQLKHLIRWG